ncbi:allergen Tha p 1-like [Maniola hyperantus]|uniref:allergen Tha p 1-like n=1 Tax=Aphantopus hyperantus TaxID=2795564 RepID=UPI00156A6873|nr:allergen Tha p 1-like [Maniola hyperantus]
MQIIVVLATLVATALAIPADTYNPKYDSFNVQELKENPRLLSNFGKCFIDKAPCTAEGSAFKKIVPEAVQTSCGKCTPKQRELVRVIIRAFQKDLPEIWAELVKKHDPNGQYKESFNNFLNADN